MVLTSRADPKPPPNGHIDRNAQHPQNNLTAAPTTTPPPLPSPSSPPPLQPERTGVSNPAYVSDEESDDGNNDGEESTGKGASTNSTGTCSTSVSRPTSGYLTLQPSDQAANHLLQQQHQQYHQQQQLYPRRTKSEVVLSARSLTNVEEGRSEDDGGGGSGRRSAVEDVAPWGPKRSWLALAASQGQRNTSGNNNVYDDDDDDLRTDNMVVVERPIFTEYDFDQEFEKAQAPKRTPWTWAKKKAGKCVCSCACVRGFLLQVLPFLRLMRGYSLKTDLPADIIAGLTVGIMHIPQGMAYGQLSSLPPVYGLYTSFFPVILYFFLGTSKHISMGTFAVVSLMVGTVVDKGLAAKGIAPATWNHTETVNGTVTTQPLDNSDQVLQAKLAFALAVTFAVGCVQLLLGIFRLGFLTVYLSDPLVSGFTTGAACHVFTSQVRHIFGLRMGSYAGPLKLVYSYRDLLTNLPQTNSVTLIASLLCILLLVLVKEYLNNNPRVRAKLKMPLPVELLVVVLGTVISYLVNLEETYGVETVGEVPVGIPAPKVQQFTYLSDVLSDAVAIAIVAFAVSVSMAKILAKKHDYQIDPDQELLAYGTVNITCSFFSSFCAAASLSRTLVMENVGCRTQVTGLVSSALLLVVLLVLGSYFRTLPNCILAAIIVVALKGMFKQFAELKRLWNISLIDFMVWLVAFLATVLLDVDLGLVVAILFALLTVIIRNQRPYACLLGQVPNTDLYRDVAVVKAAKELDHIKIFRFDSALFFANSENFKTALYKLTVDPGVLKKLKKKAEKELFNIHISSPSDKGKPSKDQSLPDTSVNPKQMLRGTGDMDPNPRPPGDAASQGRGSRKRSELWPRAEKPAVILPTGTDVYFVIIDCTAMTYVDSVGVKVLQQVITELRTCAIQVFLAHCKDAVRDMFQKTDFYSTSDKQCLFLTVHDAVLYAQGLIAFAHGEDDSRSGINGKCCRKQNFEAEQNLVATAEGRGGTAESRSVQQDSIGGTADRTVGDSCTVQRDSVSTAAYRVGDGSRTVQDSTVSSSSSSSSSSTPEYENTKM